MSRKCIIETHLYQSASAVKFVEVKKEDFLMIADLALKQLAIPKTETDGCEWCDGEAHYLSQGDYTLLGIQGNTLYASGDDCTDIQINYCPMCGRKLK